MTSRLSWNVEGIEPSVRDRAEAAAQRAGMSLNDWLNATAGDVAPPPKTDANVAEIHQRLDSITRQIDQISQSGPAKRDTPGVASQLNDAISRLDARLSQISDPAPAQRTPVAPAPVAAPPPRVTQPIRPSTPIYRQAPTTIPELLDFDVAEIVARQNQLDNASRQSFMQTPPGPVAPQPVSAPDLSGFEKQLQNLTSQIESLRRPDTTDQSVTALRGELAEIRQAITEALPRRALESLENEIRSVAMRIDRSRHSGADNVALQSVEQALRDVHATLRTLTPAEQLAGFDEAIRNLGGKIDMIVRASPDSGSMQQLQDAVGALRAIVSNVASNEAISRLSDDVRTLAAKVDQLTEPGGLSGSMTALEQRIAALTTALESRERPSEDSNRLETAVRTLSDRLDHLQLGGDASAAFSHVEQRVLQLLDRLEMADTRAPNFGRVEEGLSDILRQLEQQRTSFAALHEQRPSETDQDTVGMIRRELSDIRHSQSEFDRNTQDALESVHNTLGHVVDRLAMIEGDLRESRTLQSAQQDKSAPHPAPGTMSPIISSTAISAPMQSGPRLPSFSSVPRPELPNPASLQNSTVARASQPTAPPPSEIQRAADDITPTGEQPAPWNAAANYSQPELRSAIDPSLPPDTPLEPGTRLGDGGSVRTPSQRIAASESVLSEISSTPREPTSTSSFIAAARRAAQAAANPANEPKAGRRAGLGPEARAAAEPEGAAKTGSRIRSLLVGASVVVIVLSGFKLAMSMLDAGTSSPPAASIDKPAGKALEKSSDAASSITAPGGNGTTLLSSERNQSSMTSPIPIDRQSLIVPSAPIIQSPPESNPAATSPADTKPIAPDVTGTIEPSRVAPIAAASTDDRKTAGSSTASLTAVSDNLPDAIGGPTLRNAALKGDPAAAYEVAVRFAEGKGVAVNYDEASKWYDRAADGGIVPAMFRLGTLYEKGLGGTKDVDAAKRYYIRAAERGNAKAMHNLAVLDADGGNKGPNYASAAQWFRKAAERGVADSQFNLGILYARGIGVEQNLAESFKWFSLAAAQGDTDAGRKRDDVAKRLDAQSLAAAKLAIQTFVAESQPNDAVNVAAPPAGWDAVPAAAIAPAAKRAPKPLSKMSAAGH